jgi:hypothetical protein
MIRTIMIAVVALMLSAGPAAATDFYEGNELLAKCRAYERFTAAGRTTNDIQVAGNAMLCREYVFGVVDGLENGGAPTCYPDGVTYQQILAVTLKHLKENLAQLHRPSSDLVREALREAWPCN